MRPRKRDDTGSLDSLLDTLTNVVGILVIVLVVTMMDVNQAVEQVKFRDIREEDLAEVVADVERATVESAELTEQLTELTGDVPPETTFRLEAAVAALDTQLQAARQTQQQAQQARQRQDQLRQQVAAQAAKADQLQETVEAQRLEVRTLRARLDQPSTVKTPPARSIALPDPRPAPKGASARFVFCHYGTVQFFDVNGYQQRAEKRALFLVSSRKLDQDKAKGIDAQVFKKLFDERPISDGQARVELVIRGAWGALQMIPRKQGETAERLAEGSSRYESLLRRLSGENIYLRFIVWPDSYDAYLVARQLANNYEIPAGWQPYTAEHFSAGLPKVRFGPPPPKAPPPKTPPPKRLPPKLID